MDKYEELKKLISEHQNITFLTGAGISTNANIPDWRSSEGIWTKNNDLINCMTKGFYNRKPKIFWKAYKEIFQDKLTKTFKPTFAHKFIGNLQDKNIYIITQNVDGLHQQAGNKNVLEVHGNIKTATCPKCKTEYDIDFINQYDIPHCHRINHRQEKCNFILKPDVVLFGDIVKGYPQAEEMVEKSKLFIVIGTSLEVFPIKNLIPFASLDEDTTLVLINDRETKLDKYFHLKIYDDIDRCFQKLK